MVKLTVKTPASNTDNVARRREMPTRSTIALRTRPSNGVSATSSTPAVMMPDSREHQVNDAALEHDIAALHWLTCLQHVAYLARGAT